MDVTIGVGYEGDTATVALGGYLNTNTAPELEAKLEEALGRAVNVTLDFAGLEYLSSAGLRVLVSAQKRVMGAGGHLRIEHASDEIREVFEITGLIDVFDVAE